MARRSEADEELGITDLIQIKITVSQKDIDLWHRYSKEVGYPTAMTGRDFFRIGLMQKIAESNKALVWQGLLEKHKLPDAQSDD